MIRNLNKRISINRLTLILLRKISTSKQFKQKLTSKKYLEILGLGENQKINLYGKDLHRAYLNQIKKFHSDGVHTQEAKKQFDQITKCITQAYDQIKKSQGVGAQDKKDSYVFSQQESVSQELFGKSYIDIKHTLYAPGNDEMRIKFITQLQKRRAAKYTSSQETSQTSKSSTAQTRYSNSNNNNYSSNQNNSGSEKIGVMALVGVICAACIPFFWAHTQKKEINGVIIDDYQPKEHKLRQYSEKQYDVIHLNSQKLAALPLQRFYNKLLKNRPHMLNYPTGYDPDILQQLATYSIAPDIRLYEVPPKYFIDKTQYHKLLEGNGVQAVPKYELKQTKPNTLLTLSLQAQRALHNIYINVDDLLAQIKETGKFTPPKIFFKFHGYIMFQVRDKPFSNLISYRNTKYISLFDLYFDYYSPIFFKRDYYKEYLTGYRKQDAHLHTRYFGNVYLNHRQIPLRYLQKGQKVVIMKEYKSCLNSYGNLKETQSKYNQDWQNYYAQFQKNWKNYCHVQLHQE